MRQKISLAVLVALVMGVVYVGILPFWLHHHKVKDFCYAISPTASLDDIRQNAIAQGFKVSDSSTPIMMIYDTRTMGKTTCFVTQQDGKISVSYLAD